jgi:hypothetical protein
LLGALAFTNPWTGWISPDTATGAGWSFGRYRSGPGMLYLLLAKPPPCSSPSAPPSTSGAARAPCYANSSPPPRRLQPPHLTVFINRTNLLQRTVGPTSPRSPASAPSRSLLGPQPRPALAPRPLARSFVLGHHDHA